MLGVLSQSKFSVSASSLKNTTRRKLARLGNEAPWTNNTLGTNGVLLEAILGAPFWPASSRVCFMVTQFRPAVFRHDFPSRAESVTPSPLLRCCLCRDEQNCQMKPQSTEPCVWMRGLCMFLPDVYPAGVLWRRLPLDRIPDMLRRQTLWFTAAYSSILAWKIQWTEEPGRLKSIGSQSQTWLRWLSRHACMNRVACARQVLWCCTLINVMANHRCNPLNGPLRSCLGCLLSSGNTGLACPGYTLPTFVTQHFLASWCLWLCRMTKNCLLSYLHFHFFKSWWPLNQDNGHIFILSNMVFPFRALSQESSLTCDFS